MGELEERQAAPPRRTWGASRLAPELCTPPALPTPLPCDSCEARAKAGLLGGTQWPGHTPAGGQGLSSRGQTHIGQLLSHTCWYFNTHGERPTDGRQGREVPQRERGLHTAAEGGGKAGAPEPGCPANSPD